MQIIGMTPSKIVPSGSWNNNETVLDFPKPKKLKVWWIYAWQDHGRSKNEKFFIDSFESKHLGLTWLKNEVNNDHWNWCRWEIINIEDRL